MKHFRPILFFVVALMAVISSPSQTQVTVVNPCIQSTSCFHYGYTCTVASSSTLVMTIQEPAASPKLAQLTAAVVQCANQAFSVAQATGGTAATATAQTAVPVYPTPSTTAAKVIPYTASNVGTGASIAALLNYTAGDPRVLDLTWMALQRASENYTITVTNTGTSSCVGAIDIFWQERQ